LPLGLRPHAVAAEWKPAASAKVARSGAGVRVAVLVVDIGFLAKWAPRLAVHE
jgi:hypothetical protein